MILTRKQEEGLKIAVERHRAHEKYTVIAGYVRREKSLDEPNEIIRIIFEV